MGAIHQVMAGLKVAAPAGGTVNVGTETIGGIGASVTNRRWGIAWTAPQTGTLDRIYVYSSNAEATADLKIGLHEDTGSALGNVVSGSPTVFTDVGTWSLSWKEFTVSFPVVSGTSYRIGFQQSAGEISFRFDPSGPAGSQRENYSEAYAAAWDNAPSSNTDTVLWSVYGRITY